MQNFNTTSHSFKKQKMNKSIIEEVSDIKFYIFKFLKPTKGKFK